MGDDWNDDESKGEHNEWEEINERFYNDGYREGQLQGREKRLQDGFNVGYLIGKEEGLVIGNTYGVIMSLLEFCAINEKEHVISLKTLKEKCKILREKANKLRSRNDIVETLSSGSAEEIKSLQDIENDMCTSYKLIFNEIVIITKVIHLDHISEILPTTLKWHPWDISSQHAKDTWNKTCG